MYFTGRENKTHWWIRYEEGRGREKNKNQGWLQNFGVSNRVDSDVIYWSGEWWGGEINYVTNGRGRLNDQRGSWLCILKLRRRYEAVDTFKCHSILISRSPAELGKEDSNLECTNI